MPDVMGIMETKLCEGTVSTNLGGGKYDVWRRYRMESKEEG